MCEEENAARARKQQLPCQRALVPEIPSLFSGPWIYARGLKAGFTRPAQGQLIGEGCLSSAVTFTLVLH